MGCAGCTKIGSKIWSHGSVGRAHRSHRWGHRFESCCDHHSKYQLLIQRLVLFFYPMAAQKHLWQRGFRHFLEKVSRYNHHSDHANRRGRQNRFPRLYFFTPLRSKGRVFKFCQIIYGFLIASFYDKPGRSVRHTTEAFSFSGFGTLPENNESTVRIRE